MTVRASDLEATAIGVAAAAAIALKTHEMQCLTCARARQARQQDKCCPAGYEMVITIHQQNKLVDRIRADRKEARKHQGRLF